MDDPHAFSSLHYDSPASSWSEALPIGNGRLGGMIYGRTSTELIQLNEDSVWYGGPQDRTPGDAHRNLDRLRQLIRDEQHSEAESLVREAFFATPASMRHYEPLGSCTLEFGHGDADVCDFKRRLNIATSQSTVEYQSKNVFYRRHAIASFPDNVLAIRFEASEKSRFVIRLNRLSEVEWETNEYLDSIEAKDDRIILHATPGGKGSNRLTIVLGVSCDQGNGHAEAVGNCLIVNTSRCTIVIGAQTSYRVDDTQQAASQDVSAALGRPWDELVDRHQQDYMRLFNRTALRLWPDANHLPTDTRLKDARDPGLAALYHNYGRYLLISSSRDSYKALPATLQGIWNPSFAPAWGSKYTININLQMNYWPAAPCNLVECAMPVVALLERMAERGTKTAKVMYGCRGWCAHHNTDIWADTDPQDRWMPSTIWPLGGVWVCIDIVKMLTCAYDRTLHERIAPILQGCVLFLLDFLVPSACGRYVVTNPSLSPENTFISKSGEAGILCEGSVIDMAIVRIALEQFLWSTDILDRNHSLRDAVEETLAKIPPVTINGDGLIQEWGLNNYEEQEPGHRHVSHLFGLYPDDAINPITSPELAKAAKGVLDRRAAHGGGHTGWSRAWLLNLHARLFDADGCRQHMDLLFRDSTLPNMLDSHPPFQIDGNFGGCAGILECLVQSIIASASENKRVVEIRLLPACPESWTCGSVARVRVKDGWLVSLDWTDGQISSIVLEATEHTRLDAVVVSPNGGRVLVRATEAGQQQVGLTG